MDGTCRGTRTSPTTDPPGVSDLMIRTIDMKQREAAMPTAALVGPSIADLQPGTGWHGGFANPRERGIASTLGFTATRSTRHLGRSST